MGLRSIEKLMAGSRIPMSKESAMIHALEAGGVAWLMINVALFVARRNRALNRRLQWE
jgi:hypothetical protein